MVDGFDSRQAGRSTFAFNPSTPAQSRAASSGGSRGAGVQGGQIEGGYVAAGPRTQAAPGEGIPSFLADLMEPYIERKQQEQFFEGFTAAEGGRALDEIHKSDKLSSIFGPSHYEEGAAFYTAKKKIDDWNAAALGDMDNLKRLAPADLSKVLAAKSRELMTGNVTADQIIQKGLLEATGPLLNTVTKARYEWQQTEALTAKAGAADSAASVFQQTMAAQAGLSNPSDDDRATRAQAVGNMVGSFMQDPSMSDDTYRKFIKQGAHNMLAQGNFYAFEVMRGKGLLKSGGPLDDETIAGLESKYTAAANRAYSEASYKVMPDLLALDLSTKDETQRDPQKAIVAYAQKATAINGKLAAITGIQTPFLTAEDIRKGAGNVTDTLLAAFHRREARQQQIDDHNRDRAEKAADEQAARDQVAAEAHAAWGAGDASAAILGGMKRDDLDTLARNEWLEGNVTNIVRQFNLTGYGAAPVAQLAQAGITASLGQGYTKDFDKTYQQWKVLNKASPGAARKYYNTHYVAMQKYDMLVKTTKPELAWVKAFGDPGQYGAAMVPPRIRAEVEQQIPEAIARTEAWSIMGHGYINLWARERLNPASSAIVSNRLRNRVALSAANSDELVPALVNGELQHMLADGSLERAGPLAWSNQPNNRKLSDIVKARPAELDSAFYDLANTKLIHDGFSDGASGDNVAVHRIKDQGGKAVFWVTATDDKGENSHDVVMTSDELNLVLTRRRTIEVKGNQVSGEAAASSRAGLDPYRNVKGESGWERLKRINREVAAGSSPLRKDYGIQIVGPDPVPHPGKSLKAAASSAVKAVGSQAGNAGRKVGKAWTKANDEQTKFRGWGPQRSAKK